MFLSTFLLSIKTYIPVAIIQILFFAFLCIIQNPFKEFSLRTPNGDKLYLIERLLIHLIFSLICIVVILILGGIFVYLSIFVTNSLLGLKLFPLDACMYAAIVAFAIFLVIFVFLKLYIGAEVKSLEKLLNELEKRKSSLCGKTSEEQN